MSEQTHDREIAIVSYPAQRYRDGNSTPIEDCVVVEEPLEIRVDGRRFTTTMRTPAGQESDELLTRGLLLTEGVIAENDDIAEVRFDPRCRDLSSELVNIVDVLLHDAPLVPEHLWERALISNSSCGLCGKASIEALRTRVEPLPSHPSMKAETLLQLSAKLREAQHVFEQTGGSHAAALFDARGEMLAWAEDIGRHNATDKVIGRGMVEGWLPWRGAESVMLLVSGRASFELVQKALMARVPILCAVSAVSSLAVELAHSNRLTLIGFLRERGFTVYAGEERVSGSSLM